MWSGPVLKRRHIPGGPVVEKPFCHFANIPRLNAGYNFHEWRCIAAWGQGLIMRTLRGVFVAIAAFGLSGCVQTSIQGYADRDLPSQTIQHIAVYIAAPGPLASSMQSSVVSEARKRGISAEDALTILPPTRKYIDADVRKALAERKVDGVLLITVADSGVISQYAGTVFQSSYNGTSSANGTMTQMGNTSTVSLNGNSSGTAFGTATPTYRYSRHTAFSARLVEPKSERNLWVGSGEINASGGKGIIGRLIVADDVSSSNSISAIFDDLQKKGLIGSGEAG
ncbi:MAG: hypothetical protein WA792_14965 [Pseudolabrys sp.]